jgi:hypothetical protein
MARLAASLSSTPSVSRLWGIIRFLSDERLIPGKD